MKNFFSAASLFLGEIIAKRRLGIALTAFATCTAFALPATAETANTATVEAEAATAQAATTEAVTDSTIASAKQDASTPAEQGSTTKGTQAEANATATVEPAASATTDEPALVKVPKATTGATATILADSSPTQSNVYVVPIEGPINRTQLFILRRALKEALNNDVDTVVLNMDTPGGALNVTLEMMEALQRFPGRTITYVNTEAISAGSYISMATSEIWFAPGGIMGAAEAVTGSGQDIAEGMQRKVSSVLRAKVRSLNTESRYRADVQRAMMDPAFVLEIDGTVMKKEGELLSLTAAEAAQTYGEPPEALLSSGTADSVEALLTKALGSGSYTIRTYELTWSETFAKWFQTFTPLLLGVGMMLLFIEFKTPGFGFMGGIGIALLLLVFASNYFAGLAGYEVLLIFLLGIALLAVEALVLPGTLVAGILGILLILGSLVWAMADVWPQGAEDSAIDAATFARPLINLGIGMVIAVAGSILAAKLLPRTRVGRSLILSTSVGGKDALVAGGGHRDIEYGQQHSDTTANGSNATASSSDTTNATTSPMPEGLPAIGKRGTAVTPLRPSGQVEIDGRRYEARLTLGQVDKGEIVEVIGYRDFALLVRRT